MLSDSPLEAILDGIGRLTFGVLGDLFLDRYLDIDGSLTEPSIETGLDAYQVVRVRSYPGAAGTVINNLHALGVRRIWPVAVIGDDGEGYELRQALARMGSTEPAWIVSAADRRTPTYTKPMLHEAGQQARELNRLDIKNRTPTPRNLEDAILKAIDSVWPELDALLVLDQVSEADCGVVTARVRARLTELGETWPERIVLVDSRERAGLFRSVWLKPNQAECGKAVGKNVEPHAAAEEMARRTGRPVFCTCGQKGIILVDPRSEPLQSVRVPAYPVDGPIDIVGAGDSTSAGIACAAAAGATLGEAAAFGNLVASITIQQIGTTGTASPEQVRQRWAAVRDVFGSPP